MKFGFRLFLLIVACMVIAPMTPYAAFPIKGTVVAPSIAGNGSENISSMQHPSTGKHISRLHHFPERVRQPCYRWIAIVLAVISIGAGGLGLHNFYLGYIGLGIIQLLAVAGFVAGCISVVAALFGAGLGFLLLGIILIGLGIASWIWQISELIRICVNDLKPKRGRYSRYPQDKKQVSELNYDD